jgi:hypothetical protein
VSRLWNIALLTSLSLAYAAFLLQLSRPCACVTLVDDAMISMTYARNAVAGLGLTWGPQAVRVEGFTNLLYVMVMAFWQMLLPAWASIAAVAATGALILVAAVALALATARAYHVDGPLARFGLVLLIGTYYPLAYWSLRGMETGLVYLLLVWLFYLVAESRGIVAFVVVIALAYLNRMDSLPTMLAVFVTAGFVSRAGCRPLIAVVALVVVVVGVHVFWRWTYYGDIWPNTYYLKMTGVPLIERVRVGLARLDDELREGFVVVYLLAGLCAWVSRYQRDTLKRILLLLILPLILQTAYSIYVGGDYAENQVFGANRFLTVAVGPVFLAGVIVAASSQIVLTAVMRGAVVALLLGAFAILNVAPLARFLSAGDEIFGADLRRRRTGLMLRAKTDADAVCAAHAIGQVAYYSQRQTLDLLGVVDPVIARQAPRTAFRPGHNKWDYTYSLREQRPDVIVDDWGALRTDFHELPRLFAERDGVFVRRDSRRVYREAQP